MVLFKSLDMPTFSGGTMVVTVSFGDNVSGRFVVDTGASMVLLPEYLAKKAGLPLDGPKMQSRIADGSVIENTSVLIPSITVEGRTAYEVEGAISPEPLSEEVDGLLGMSFLSRFHFRIDAENGQLILQPK